MALNFNVTGTERKELVTAIGEITGGKPKYCKAPSFAYEVDGCTIDKAGTVIFDETPSEDALAEFLSKLEARGFVCEDAHSLDAASDDGDGFGDIDGEPDEDDKSGEVIADGSHGAVMDAGWFSSQDETPEPAGTEENNIETDTSAVDNDIFATASGVEAAGLSNDYLPEYSKRDGEEELASDGASSGESYTQMEAAERCEDASLVNEETGSKGASLVNETPSSENAVFASEEPEFAVSAPTYGKQDAAMDTETLSASNEIEGNLSIDMPLNSFTYSSFSNLENLVAAKAWVFKKMTGAEELSVERLKDRLSFPWFPRDSSHQDIDAYTRLISRLCETAKTKQRIAAKERKPKDGDNEKFKARCTLLMLGFIGDEYAEARKILLSPFSGNGSFLKGDGKKDMALSGGLPAPAAIFVRKDGDGVCGESADTASPAPLRCDECPFHCYYTDGPFYTDFGDTVDVSGRTPDKYTHYCLKAPSGFRKIKHAVDWSGYQTAPKWCPRYRSDIQESGADIIDDAVTPVEDSAGMNDHHECLACSHSHSSPTENC